MSIQAPEIPRDTATTYNVNHDGNVNVTMTKRHPILATLFGLLVLWLMWTHPLAIIAAMAILLLAGYVGRATLNLMSGNHPLDGLPRLPRR